MTLDELRDSGHNVMVMGNRKEWVVRAWLEGDGPAGDGPDRTGKGATLADALSALR